MRNRISELYSRGLGCGRIAREVGLSCTQVHRIVMGLGISEPNRRKTKHVPLCATCLRLLGFGNTYIGKRLFVAKSTVKRSTGGVAAQKTSRFMQRLVDKPSKKNRAKKYNPEPFIVGAYRQDVAAAKRHENYWAKHPEADRWRYCRNAMAFYHNTAKADPNYVIRRRLRCRLYKFIRGEPSKSISSIIGCQLSELLDYIESLFQPGMSWDNMGDWHIDHITPCSLYDLTDQAQREDCFHFSNLQPIWAEDNHKKSDYSEHKSLVIKYLESTKGIF